MTVATTADTRITTDRLLTAAMDRARGRTDGGDAAALDRLTAAARAFAAAVAPTPPRRGVTVGRLGGVAAELAAERGGRVVVRLARGDGSVAVSGPRGEPGLWALDAVDASEADALALLEAAAAAWPPVAPVDDR